MCVQEFREMLGAAIVAEAAGAQVRDNVLNIINQIMDVCIPQERAPRDFCVKFPEEIRHDNLAGQLWFGAEVCLAAGSIIMNRELESMAMRPLAKELTRSLE
ncbi:hypothetical protein E2I00_009340, partial [Balaenoptera physalus]